MSSVSVVVPCYRCVGTIERAVASVAAQTRRPLEVILVDDASGDGTFETLQRIAQSYENGWVKVHSLSHNSGPSGARNIGWGFAKGDYIAFLDADDTWHPDKIVIQQEFMDKNGEVALSGHLCGEAIPVHSDRSAGAWGVSVISAKRMLFKNPFSTPTVMLRANLNFKFAEGRRYAEDIELWQQIAFAGHKVVRIGYPFAKLHKAAYGEDGLSANLWRMEKGELSNFYNLFRDKKIGFMLFFFAYFFSCLKFGRRLIVRCMLPRQTGRP